MLQKQLLIAGSVLGALALGHQAVSADTVPTTTDTNTAQSVQATTKALPQVKAVALMANVNSLTSATSSSDDDSNLPGGDTGSSSGHASSSSSSDNSGTDTPTPTKNDDNDNGSTLPNQKGSASSSDKGGSSSSSDNKGSVSKGGGTNSATTGGNGGTSSNNNPIPSTPTTPDTNNQGAVNPVTVTPDNSGRVVDVPTQVASVPSVSRAVKAYNQALSANGKDANNDKVVDAKQKLDDAVAKALPETHATQAKSSIGILSAVSGVLAMTGALIFKRFKN